MTDGKYTYTKLSNHIIRRLLPAAVFLSLCTPSAGEFLVPPYLQNLSTHGIALVWFSGEEEPGRLQCFSGDDKEPVFQAVSSPQQVKIVKAPPFRYRHVVNVTGLKPNTLYRYEVVQRRTKFHATFHTPPKDGGRVRFIVYADCETEPESTGKRVAWDDPRRTGEKRLYLVDQTTGYANNLAVIRSRRPSFIVIAGDLVQSGGEQQDWDEFWRHNTALD